MNTYKQAHHIANTAADAIEARRITQPEALHHAVQATVCARLCLAREDEGVARIELAAARSHWERALAAQGNVVHLPPGRHLDAETMLAEMVKLAELLSEECKGWTAKAATDLLHRTKALQRVTAAQRDGVVETEASGG